MPDRQPVQAARLIATRKALGYAEQSAFADELGVAKNTLNGIETGGRPVSQNVAFKMREKFRISMDWTYYGDPKGLPESVWQKIRKSA